MVEGSTNLCLHSFCRAGPDGLSRGTVSGESVCCQRCHSSFLPCLEWTSDISNCDVCCAHKAAAQAAHIALGAPKDFVIALAGGQARNARLHEKSESHLRSLKRIYDGGGMQGHRGQVRLADMPRAQFKALTGEFKAMDGWAELAKILQPESLAALEEQVQAAWDASCARCNAGETGGAQTKQQQACFDDLFGALQKLQEERPEFSL